ncbi:MAG TPA: hypothetical protein VF721_11755 [Pyrinomonadaceae bacterium]
MCHLKAASKADFPRGCPNGSREAKFRRHLPEYDINRRRPGDSALVI